MPRTLPKLDATAVAAVEMAWRVNVAPWARARLTVLRLIAREGLPAKQIAALTGVAHSTVFRYLAKFQAGGVAELLRREHKGGKTKTLTVADYRDFVEQLRQRNPWRAKDAQAWTRERTGRTLALSGIYNLLKKARRESKPAARISGQEGRAAERGDV